MEGTYKCTAKNKENTASSSAALHVYGKIDTKIFFLILSQVHIIVIEGVSYSPLKSYPPSKSFQNSHHSHWKEGHANYGVAGQTAFKERVHVN